MITLQFFNGLNWVAVSTWNNESMAWISLSGDDFCYRTVNEVGEVLTDKNVRK